MIDSIVLQNKLLDWYEREVRYWSSGTHGQSEQFRYGVISILTRFQEEIILGELDKGDA